MTELLGLLNRSGNYRGLSHSSKCEDCGRFTKGGHLGMRKGFLGWEEAFLCDRCQNSEKNPVEGWDDAKHGRPLEELMG